MNIDEHALLLGSGTAYSHRDGVNLILPGTGDDLGNSRWTRARGPVRDEIRSIVLAAIGEARRTRRLWPSYPKVIVAVYDEPARGEYRVFVYGRVS